MQRPVYDMTRMLIRRDRVRVGGIDRVDQAYFNFVAEQDGLYVARLGGRMRYFSKEGARAALEVPLRRIDLPHERLKEGRKLLRHETRRSAEPLTYLNTSHTDPGAWTHMKARGDNIVVLIHDLLPLTHPTMFRPQTSAPFTRFTRNVAAHADLVLTSCRHTARQWKSTYPQGAPTLTLPLGTSPLTRGEVKPRGEPYFVSVGTIEPRKNHAFLLDLWDQMGPNAPLLHIVGRPGWASADVFDRLARAERVIWHQNMDDAQMASLVAGASALLFPSHAEGYGYPPIEAARLGTPTISAPLPSLREALGVAIRQIPLDPSLWRREITACLDTSRAERRRAIFRNYIAPTWEDHFENLQDHLEQLEARPLPSVAAARRGVTL